MGTEQAHDQESTPTAARPTKSRFAGPLGRLSIAGVVLAVAGAAVWYFGELATPDDGPAASEIPALQVDPAPVRPGTDVPVYTDVAEEQPEPQAGGASDDPLAVWAAEAADATGVPSRALWAYANAELAVRAEQPQCRLSWATLAGIGRIESDHGRYGGTRLGADGRPEKPIIGVPLDGSPGVRAIADTDGGALDGDPRYDRAVGPMQFIPTTWATWATDGNGDGRADPHQIDDAAAAAARYLCADGRDMSSAEGWWAGLMSYNRSVEYGQKVFGLADSYARAVDQRRQ
ncbi:membrane-bound lytic murein transglycosylase B [Tamaricihabitans halophyticus]|uniref:Membrane-bound lytic murein transglycosylase B n=1 Tax=Tamaricihabitans halophyticus TaxID=1262583 RepID=A0A4R2QFK6_9PSEU|nr:lytic murein transglycosylase [Tamaricihabitans halophyticus]TCP47920.1 membrane-bound lytic murein transglycosylase B [Tamaricihabitans halophyticus]